MDQYVPAETHTTSTSASPQFLLDGGLRVIRLNASALREINSGVTCMTDRDGRFVLQEPALNKAMRNEAEALLKRPEAGTSILRLGECGSSDVKYLIIKCVRSFRIANDGDGQSVPVMEETIHLTVRDPKAAVSLQVDDLVRGFNLTPKEAQLSLALANGIGLKKFASAEKLSIKTARWHWGNVREKLNVRSQLALARLLMRLDVDV